MAKSKLGVVENGAEQAVVEAEAGFDSQPALEIPAAPESGEAPAPVLTDEEAAILAHEGEAALREMGEGQLEPPTPFDIPPPGDVVVSFDKINEILLEEQATAREAERIAAQDTRLTPLLRSSSRRKRRRLPKRIRLPHRKKPKGRKRNRSLLSLKRPGKRGRPETRK